MKKYNPLFLFVLVTAFIVPNAVAQTCPTAPTGPHESGGQHWFDYSPDSGCVSVSGASSTSMCYGGGYEAGYPSQATISYSFVALSNKTYGYWSADAFVDFTDPNDSSLNYVDGWAIVTHSGVTSYTNLFYHNGSQGDLGCARPWGTFSAVAGDDVTIEIYASRYHQNTTIIVSDPNVFSTQYP
jgi:hypothetical protein